MAFTLPPPPQSNDISGPAWQDWFYKLARQLTTSSPDADQAVFSGLIFNHRQDAVPPSVAASDTGSVMVGQVFAKRPIVQRLALDVIDSNSILSNQIFGG